MGSLATKVPPGVPLDTQSPDWLSKAAFVLNNALAGKLHNQGTVTLNNGGAIGWQSTTVSDARAGPDSVILLMGTNQLGAIALDQWWISTRTKNAFTITHVSTSTATCTAAYAIFG